MAADTLPALRKLHRRNYRGVYWSPTGGWIAQQSSQGVLWSIPCESELEAARVYDEQIRKVYGKDGLYNFPREGERSVFCPGCEQCGPPPEGE